MSGYLQRYPNQPKAQWFKRYTEKASLGKRTIYVATPTLGFEVDGFPQTLVARQLYNGQLTGVNGEGCTYIEISNNKALKLLDRFYIFNPSNNEMEEHDLIEEEIEIIPCNTSDVIRIEKNAYVRKFSFDCMKESEQQNQPYQPLQGLPIDATYLTLKTHMFCEALDEPKHEDLLYYQGRFWTIEDTRKSYYYIPKEKSVLHLTIKAINK